MSVTSTHNDAALASAAAVIRCLPATDLTPSQALEGVSGLAQAIPAPGSKAVTAALTGAVSGTIVLVLSPELAAQVENGPIGPQDLLAGLDPALTDGTAALASMFGDVRFEVPQALDAEVALANVVPDADVSTVIVAGPTGPAASLVIMLNPIAAAPGAGVAPTEGAATFETLSGTLTGGGSVRAVELLSDVEMGVTAELGRTRMTVRELLSMQPGSVVELDRAAGSPVDLLVNGTLVARGEVVVIDEEFGVRITEIIGYDNKKNGQQ